MAGSPDVNIWRESMRHVREGVEGLGDIWHHEGLKKLTEQTLRFGGTTDIGQWWMEQYVNLIAEDMTTRGSDSGLATTFAGLELDGPGGIAAGWDKSGITILGWQALGANHITIGGVPLYYQGGNPMPRLRTFDRNVGDRGKRVSLNSFGFSSRGARSVVHNIDTQKQTGDVRIPVIVQVTANKEFYEPTNRHMLPGVLAETVRIVKPVADAIEFGVTSPNTQGMREAYEILMPAREVVGDDMPVGFKGDADGGVARFDMYGRLVTRASLNYWAGINTTAKPEIKARYNAAHLPGGLAGADPEYQAMADEAVQYMFEAVGDTVDIMGMGGINTPDRALRIMKRGARAFGINTGIRALGARAMLHMTDGLSRYLDTANISSLSTIVGYDTNRN
jgi:dihydroorotate dehydrogenase